ncbi:hypothetical protein [Streptomyces sp. NPDC060022]|uniref:hypothetical protein n=1 Tax=Streptomyces sp. NPDC060022 TaxID=3347039 RepID=UPI0036C43460
MRWPWQRAARTSASAQPRLLPSASEGICFEAVYTIVWRPRWSAGPQVEECVRAHVHATAMRAAAAQPVVDLPAAQDQVNAALCSPHLSPYYRLLSARAVLGLPAAARDLLAQQQADEQRIRRLRFLKKNLYDRPDLVVLDQMERRATGALDEELIGELQRLARLISSCDRWWFPLLQQWELVGQGFKDPEKQKQALILLTESLTALNGGTLPEALTDPRSEAAARRAHP